MNGIPIQFLNGDDTAERVYRRGIESADKIRRRQAAVQYYTRGLDNKTVRNIGYLSNGFDFVGYQGNGSIDDSEMIYNHLLRTKQIVDSAPQAVAIYQNPKQLSDMLGYVIDNWDSANREKAIDNMAREESRLIDEGKIRLANDESDAHFLDAGENYDPDTQNVLMNGAVETKPNKRGLFNRLKKTTAYVNVAQKDADIIGNSSITRKLKSTIRQNVAANRKPTTKNIKETRIKNGYVHTSTIKVPVYAAKSTSLQGLSGVDDDLQELLYGVDFAYNADEGLSVKDNIDNYRRYFARLSAAIAMQPLAFYDTEAEANAVRQMLEQLIPAIGNEAAMDALAAKYEGINGFEGIGELNGKLKNALKKATKKVASAAKSATKAVASSAKNVAKATVNATKQVAKTTANVTKAAAKATKSAVKATANATKTVTKAAANATKAVAKAAVNTTKAAVKSAVNATKATANVVKAAAQAATGNKDKAKETLKKAGQQAKSAVTQPVKAAVQSTKDVVKKAVVEPTKTVVKTAVTTTKDVVKKTVVEPVKTVAKETKAVVKNAIVEPTKTLVKETIVKPTKAAIKITKKVTKVAVKLTKKLVKAILLYNPITLLIKGGLLVALRLNMFKMASRAYLGTMSEEEAISNYGVTPEEWAAQKESYDVIYKIMCKTFQMKESKVIAALKKGASKKWDGTIEPNETDVKAAGAAANNDPELQKELDADIAEDKKELEAAGAKADNNATTESATETKPQHWEEAKVPTNQRTTKAAIVMYEQGGESSKKVADLPKGTKLYISDDKSATDGTWIAASTTDGKNSGYVQIASLAGIYEPEGQAVMVISGLADNGYDSLRGLGEAATIGATIAAAAAWIVKICKALGKIVVKAGKAVVNVVKKVVNKGKDIIEQLPQQNDTQDPEQQDVTPETDTETAAIEQTPTYNTTDTTDYEAGSSQQPSAIKMARTSNKPEEQQSSGVNKKLIIGVAAGLVGLGLIVAISNRNKETE